MTFHIAQFNVAKMVAPFDAPVMQGFVDALKPINAIADNSPGFVWRLQDDSGDATSIQAFEDGAILVNMSVWESLDALKKFVYKSKHLDFLRIKKNWFEPLPGPNLVLWWIEQSRTPTIAEGKRRLDLLSSNGPSPVAFTFFQPFPDPGAQ